MDNTVNDLRYENKFENCVKGKNETLLIFFKQKYISLFGTYSLKIPKNLIASAFFFAEADTQKRRYLPTTEANFKRWLVKHADWIIKNDHAIICVLFFCKW